MQKGDPSFDRTCPAKVSCITVTMVSTTSRTPLFAPVKVHTDVSTTSPQGVLVVSDICMFMVCSAGLSAFDSRYDFCRNLELKISKNHSQKENGSQATG